MSELLKDILANTFAKENVNVSFPNMIFSLTEVTEIESLKALERIKAIIEDDNLSDFDCIEEIVCVFEDIGSSGGNRHDFG